MSAKTYESQVQSAARSAAQLEGKAADKRQAAAKKRQEANRAISQISRSSSASVVLRKQKAAAKAEEDAAKLEKDASAFEIQAGRKRESQSRAQDQLDRARASQERKAESERKRDQTQRDRERKAELAELKEIERRRRSAQTVQGFAPLRADERPQIEKSSSSSTAVKYDVCLSFAGEQRSYVELVARALKSRGYSVFYDEDEKAALWGKDLAEHLDRVYRLESRACIMFISKEYAEKPWTRTERRSALARALEEDEYVLPARFDDTQLDGLRPTVAYIDLAEYAPESLVELVAEKLGNPVDDGTEI